MKILIFACSNASVDLLNILSDDVELIGFCDNNKNLHNKQFKGKLVYAPSDILKIDFDYIVVASLHYDSILKQLIEIVGVPHERILVFTGKCRCPRSLGNDNEGKLKKLVKKFSSRKIGFSLSDEEEDNHDLKELYETVPEYVLKNYELEYFNYKEQKDCGIVIHKNLNCISNYLIAKNIAIWKGLSFEEISQIRDIPNDYILEGAYIHGISCIMLKGDYSNRLPCVSWNVDDDSLTVLGIPGQNKKYNKGMETKSKDNNYNKLIYIPSPLYKRNSEMSVMDCLYTKPYIKELLKKNEEIKCMGLEIVIALPNSDLSTLKIEQTTNIKLIEVESDCFYNYLATADIVVTDNSIYGLQYTIFEDKVIHLILETPNYEPPKKYTLKGYNSSSLVHYAKNVDEMLNLSTKLLEDGDSCANKRRNVRDNLCFNNNDELPKRLWQEIFDCLKSSNNKINS